MHTTPQPLHPAWQPFTPAGVAAFARGSTLRLLLVELLVAVTVAGTVVWFVQTGWCPVISSAITHLPEQGDIRGGQLNWHGASSELLGENHFLALAVDLSRSGEARSPAHIQVELGKADIQVLSLFGFVRLSYGRTWRVPCNRAELTPWWGAWRPPLLALLGLFIIIWLFSSWSILASLYCLPAWMFAFFANRDLSLAGSWRLCSAALMPGAVLMIGAILLYRLGMLEIIGLLLATATHLAIGWVYSMAGLLCVERHPAAAKLDGNPFGGSGTKQASPAEAVQASPSESRPNAPK